MKTEYRLIQSYTKTTKQPQPYLAICLVRINEDGSIAEIGKPCALIGYTEGNLLLDLSKMQEAFVKPVIDRLTMKEI